MAIWRTRHPLAPRFSIGRVMAPDRWWVRLALLVVMVAGLLTFPRLARAQGASVAVSQDSASQSLFSAHAARAQVTDASGAPAADGTPVQFHVAGPGGVVTDIGTVVDMRPTPQGDGYWLVTERGQVLAFGSAKTSGDPSSADLTVPIAAMAATPSGDGYWLVDDEGKIYAFGQAHFFGTPPVAPDESVVSIEATPTGLGYWVATDLGHVYCQGDAPCLGDGPSRQFGGS